MTTVGQTLVYLPLKIPLLDVTSGLYFGVIKIIES